EVARSFHTFHNAKAFALIHFRALFWKFHVNNFAELLLREFSDADGDDVFINLSPLVIFGVVEIFWQLIGHASLLKNNITERGWFAQTESQRPLLLRHGHEYRR